MSTSPVQLTPTINEADEVTIRAAANQMIAAAAQRGGYSIDSVPEEAKLDAYNHVKASFAEEAKKQNDPYYRMYIEEKASHDLTKNQLGAMSQSRNAAATSATYKAPIQMEVARGQCGNSWYTLTDAQKVQAVGWNEPVDRDELHRLFAVGADGHYAADYQRSNGPRYARLREVAKALNIYGVKKK
jgi:hypothetical protein